MVDIEFKWIKREEKLPSDNFEDWKPLLVMMDSKTKYPVTEVSFYRKNYKKFNCERFGDDNVVDYWSYIPEVPNKLNSILVKSAVLLTLARR